ncbi:MAG: hypothetical protein OXD33_00125, partial [Rhodobacteraceae bacterium]|nr:hypothetical protein [Paracoccaceae bacterium]
CRVDVLPIRLSPVGAGRVTAAAGSYHDSTTNGIFCFASTTSACLRTNYTIPLGSMRLNFSFDPLLFADRLVHEIAAGGLPAVDTIEKLLSEWLEDVITGGLRDRIVKAYGASINLRICDKQGENLRSRLTRPLSPRGEGKNL